MAETSAPQSSSLTSNLSAHGLNQLANLAIQLVTIPILAGHWGLETYGAWLILFTLPVYLGVGDLGLTQASANDMTAAVAQGRRADATCTFQTLQAGLLVLAVLIFGLAAWLATGPLHNLLAFAQGPSDGHAVATVLLIVVYGLLGQQLLVGLAGMRATGAYARSIQVYTAIHFLEAAALVAAVVAGATFLHAAAIYCVGHLVGTLGLRWLLHRHAPWLRTFPLRPSSSELRRLTPPALAAMSLPFSNALSMQGPTLVLGAIAGPAAVPAFTAVRTVSRVAVSVTSLVALAASPNYTVATARGDEGRCTELIALVLMTCLCVLLPAAIGLGLFGEKLVELWTGGVIQPSMALIATLAAAMLLNGSWAPISALMLAINEHRRFSYAFLALSVGSVGLTALLAEQLGAVAAGVAAVTLDGLMLICLVIQARRLGMLDAASLLAAPKIAAAVVRRNLASRGMWRDRTGN